MQFEAQMRAGGVTGTGAVLANAHTYKRTVAANFNTSILDLYLNKVAGLNEVNKPSVYG